MLRRRLLFITAVLLISAALAGLAAAQAGTGDLLALYGPAMRLQAATDVVEEYAGRPVYVMDVTLTADDDTATLAGQQTVTVTNTSPDAWDRVVFRLYPNLEAFGAQIIVSDVTVNGQAALLELDADRTTLDVLLPQALASGESTVIALRFATVITGDVEVGYNQFSYLDGVIAAPSFYPLLSVYEPGAGWWRADADFKGDAVYSETGYYQVTLTAPASWVVATSGVTVEETTEGAAVRYAIVAPLMRDFALMASEDFRVISDVVDGVRVNVVTRQREATARAGLQIALDSVQTFDAAFGLYPFAELDVVETPTSAGGIEYPGLIVIAGGVWNPAQRFFPVVIAHEVAHQWWYSLVGNDQTQDPWLDEGPTHYSVVLYFHDHVGVQAENAFLASLSSTYEEVQNTDDDLPIGLPVTAYDEDQYFVIVYNKAPLFFDFLAEAAGQDTAAHLLAEYFAAYRYEIATPADMLESFETTLGHDLDGIFANWVGEIAGAG